MKKLALIAVVAGFVFTSCKKDYTCHCTFTGGGTLDIAIKNTKKKAQDSCDAAETTYKGGDSGAACTLK